MIARIWHGWTTHENADEYESLVRKVVFDEVEKKNIPGYLGGQLLRKDRDTETEFISMMWFERIENVTDFVGTDHEVAHVPDVCRALLKRFEERVDHFEVKHKAEYKS